MCGRARLGDRCLRNAVLGLRRVLYLSRRRRLGSERRSRMSASVSSCSTTCMRCITCVAVDEDRLDRLNRAALIERNGGPSNNSYFDVAPRDLLVNDDNAIHPGGNLRVTGRALIAVLPMYDFPWTAAANDALWLRSPPSRRGLGISVRSSYPRATSTRYWRDPPRPRPVPVTICSATTTGKTRSRRS